MATTPIYGDDWRLAAIRIGTSNDRPRGLLVGGESVQRVAPLAYYVWCFRDSHGRVVVVDAGFTGEVAARRGLVQARDIVDALDEIGINAASVETVVISHLHWDHVGGYRAFPAATFVIARDEWEWTAEAMEMGGRMFDESYDLDTLSEFMADGQGRTRLLEAAVTKGSGFDLRVVGGHTPGHIVVDVECDAAKVTLLGDLAYLYDNLSLDSAPLLCFDRWHTRSLYHKLTLAESILIPGHDPLVLDRLDWRLGADVAIMR